MNPFTWIARKCYESFAEGMRQFMADLHPDAPPTNLDELRKLVAVTPAALPAAEPTTAADTPAEPEPAEATATGPKRRGVRS